MCGKRSGDGGDFTIRAGRAGRARPIDAGHCAGCARFARRPLSRGRSPYLDQAHSRARRAMPDWVRPELAAAYRAEGIEQLYSHQAASAELARAGKNFVVVTPTASGKTLCYNLPILNAVLENRDTR